LYINLKALIFGLLSQTSLLLHYVRQKIVQNSHLLQ
jgi:hypothetical protein